jgi:hypothetical protein
MVEIFQNLKKLMSLQKANNRSRIPALNSTVPKQLFSQSSPLMMPKSPAGFGFHGTVTFENS